MPRSSVSMRRRSAANPPSYLPSQCQLPSSTALLHLLQTPTRKRHSQKGSDGYFYSTPESISFPCLSGEGETSAGNLSVTSLNDYNTEAKMPVIEDNDPGIHNDPKSS